MIRSLKASLVALGLAASAAAMAQSDGHSLRHVGQPNKHPHYDYSGPYSTPALSPWMSPEIANVWRQGYQGQGTTISVFDDFSGDFKFGGNLNGTHKVQRHGEWTSQQASMVAPKAKMQLFDWNQTFTGLPLNRGLNVINFSGGLVNSPGMTYEEVAKDNLIFRTLIDVATKGTAVVAYSTGNDGVPTTGPIPFEGKDYLDYTSKYLRGTRSAIFVGALSSNGYVNRPAKIAYYSSFPGDDKVVQQQALVVGVDATKNGGLEGTSFAAPIVAGYSALLGSKFTSATPTQIARQLLATARQDTIAGYDIAVHGRGEASIARALAPARIK